MSDMLCKMHFAMFLSEEEQSITETHTRLLIGILIYATRFHHLALKKEELCDVSIVVKGVILT